MITTYFEEQLDECATFIGSLNKGSTRVRYFPQDKESVLKHIKNRYHGDKCDILLHIEHKRITGYLEVLIEKEESYLQVLALFIGQQFKEIGSFFFKHLEENYPNHKLHYVVNDYNRESRELLDCLDSTNDGLETMIHVSKENNVFIKHNDVLILDDSHYQEFTKLHNTLNKDAYWTGSLLLKEKDKFKKFMLLEDNILIGYSVLSNYGNEEEEIYFVHADTLHNRMKLISSSLEESFKDSTSVQLLLEVFEMKDIKEYKKLGFTEKEITITYTVLL